MPYHRYRCSQCSSTSPRAPSHAQARAERDRHRQRHHDGYTPDGEEYLREGFRWSSFANPFAVLLLLGVANALWQAAHWIGLGR